MAGVPSETVTVTAPRHSCLDYLPVTGTGPSATWAPATLLQKVEYYLCEGWTYFTSGVENIWDAIWGDVHSGFAWLSQRLSGLWSATKKIGTDAWQGVKNIGTAAGHAVQKAAKALHDDALEFYNWLKQKVGANAKWLLWGAAILAGVYFLPEILEGGLMAGDATASHYRKSFPRVGRRAARIYRKHRS